MKVPQWLIYASVALLVIAGLGAGVWALSRGKKEDEEGDGGGDDGDGGGDNETPPPDKDKEPPVVPVVYLKPCPQPKKPPGKMTNIRLVLKAGTGETETPEVGFTWDVPDGLKTSNLAYSWKITSPDGKVFTGKIPRGAAPYDPATPKVALPVSWPPADGKWSIEVTAENDAGVGQAAVGSGNVVLTPGQVRNIRTRNREGLGNLITWDTPAPTPYYPEGTPYNYSYSYVIKLADGKELAGNGETTWYQFALPVYIGPPQGTGNRAGITITASTAYAIGKPATQEVE